MNSQYFHRLEDALSDLTTDPATAADPIRRKFLFDGQDLSCNVNILQENVDVIHIQPDHDEVVLVLQGECGFRAGEETEREGRRLDVHPSRHGAWADRGQRACCSALGFCTVL